MKFRKKPVVVEAITFEELVEHGRKHCGVLHNGMPWSFEYKGQHITHETDDCYLIPTREGTMRFERGDMLITGVKGEIYPCKADIFAETYELASQAWADARGIHYWQEEVDRLQEELVEARAVCDAAEKYCATAQPDRRDFVFEEEVLRNQLARYREFKGRHI